MNTVNFKFSHRIKLIALSLIIISLSFLVYQYNNDDDQVTIGIILPLEHNAMNEIVSGFKETLTKIYPTPVVIKVENAQNDANLEHAIIQKMRDEQYDIIVPVGVNASQMTLSMIHDQPVISLASSLNEQDRRDAKTNKNHVAIVHDEIPTSVLVTFIHTVYPHLSHLTLIHSSADKVFPEVKVAIEEGKKLGMSVDDKMITSLPELNSVADSLSANTQAILILKDHLVVSGINVLAKKATQLHIPLITSDQGSVEAGASFALGVYERKIGEAGANLAAQILQKKPIDKLPIVEMSALTVFINTKAMQSQNQEIKDVVNAAKQMQFKHELLSNIEKMMS